MPVSGLVITLENAASNCGEAVRQIATHPALEVGDMVGIRLPAVLDVPDDKAGRDVHDWLNALPGVSHVDVVYVHFDEDDPAHEDNMTGAA